MTARRLLGYWPVAALAALVALPFVAQMRMKSTRRETAMKYALLIYSQGGEFESLSDDERNAVYAEDMAVSETSGVYGGSELHPADMATTVRVRDGQTLTTDGPFAETKEVLGGYYLIDVETLDEALEWGAKIPGAQYGTIEVRPVVTDYETVA